MPRIQIDMGEHLYCTYEEVYHDGLKKYCEEHNLSPEIKHSMVGNKCQVALTVGGEKVIAIAKPYFQESLPQVLKSRTVPMFWRHNQLYCGHRVVVSTGHSGLS